MRDASSLDDEPAAEGRSRSGRTARAILARHPAAARAGVLAVACLLVATTAFVGADVLPRGAPSPAASAGASGESPLDSGASGPAIGPGSDETAGTPPGRPGGPDATAIPDSAWSSKGIPAFPAVATLAASDVDAAGMAIRSRFTLTSRTKTPAATLAKGIEMVPPVALAVRRTKDARAVVLVPKAPLAPATSYRVTLRLLDGSLAGSWLFRTEAPLHVVSTLPADQTTDVPRDTGVEVTFDQDGVGPIAPSFTIEPSVSGRFERHARTWAFVPGAALRPSTIYTVTIRKGVRLAGSDQALEEDVRFAFETAATEKGPQREPLDAAFGRIIQESAAAERPVVELYVDRDYGDPPQRPLSSISLRVYRLPGLTSAIAAYRTLEAAPGWAERSDQRLVPTAGLPLIASFSAPIRSNGSDWDSASWVEFPAALDPGWYLVVRTRNARDQQLVLQVTDVATYVRTTTTRSVLWVNDVGTGQPIDGATLRSDDGAVIATTGTDGTSTTVIPPGDDFVVTGPEAGFAGDATPPGRAAIVPLHVEATATPSCIYPDDWYEPTNDFWHVLATDRSVYRSTDEIDAWGMVRRRDGGAVPSNAELRLSTWRWECETPAENAALAIVRVPVAGGARTGAFATAVPIREIPPGSYRLELWAGDTRVASRGIEVAQVRKPSYTFDVATDRHVLVEGDTFRATVSTAFFDGTPAPGLELRMDGEDVDSRLVTTGMDGTAEATITATWETWGSDNREGTRSHVLRVAPTIGEEAEIPDDSEGYVVLPARLLLETKAQVAGGRIRVSGKARLLDQAASEASWLAKSANWEPSGPVAAGTHLVVGVEDRWYVRVRTGRGYDFIHKRAYDRYRYDEKTRTLPSVDVVTAADGSFSVDVSRAMGGVAAPDGHSYRVTVLGADGDGRRVRSSAWAEAPDPQDMRNGEDRPPTLGFESWPEDGGAFAVGARVRLPLRLGDAAPPTGATNRYLFMTATRGLRDAFVSSAPVFVHTFSAHDVPSMGIDAVWFTGHTYVTPRWGETWARVDTAGRELKVTLTPDGARHAPGDTMSLDVRTADARGRPVSATVVLRAIDEKLYATDAAHDEAVLEDLYDYVPTGFETVYGSHDTPTGRPLGGQGGDTTGGGGRETPRVDFRDALLFERITTDTNGRGRVTFHLSDDITAWRVSGAAFTGDLGAGSASTSVAVGLPLFIEAPLAPDYLLSDRPVLMVRAYGSGLSSGQAVAFTVSAPSLGLSPTTVVGRTFTAAAVPLPALRLGDHELRIEASATKGGRTIRDALVRTVHVVRSRFTGARTGFAVLPELPAIAGTGMASYVFADAGRGKYLWAVRELAWGGGDRVDEALAAGIARGVLEDAFGITEDVGSGYPSYLYRYQKAAPERMGVNTGAGIALLPYASPDLALSARVSLLAPDGFDQSRLRDYFTAIREDPTSTRERRNLALAGLAGLDPSVAPDVAAALRTSGPTVRERLYLALAAAILGDHPTAIAAERVLVAVHGERLGAWLRLHVGATKADILEATSLLALIAVTVGDPIADAAEAYVEEHFSREDLYDLQKAAFLRGAVLRAPSAAARFEYTLVGVRRSVSLSPGETYALDLTPAQRATFSAKTLSGRVGVTVRWDEPIAPASVSVDPSLGLTRTMTPASPIAVGSVVTVVLTPKLGGFTTTGCYRVVDLAPSGLLPLRWAYGGTHGSEDVTPWAIDGQRVFFCTVPTRSRPARLVYYARVVTPGTYSWEPARMQADRATESGAITQAERVEIR